MKLFQQQCSLQSGEITEIQELCTTQAEALQNRNPPVTTVQLTREGALTVPAQQAGYPCDEYIITHLALQALQRHPGAGINSNMSFTKILQGPEESFVQFLDRL